VRSNRPPRIFAGLAEICGYYGNLGEGFRELGARFALVTIYPDPFRYRDDQNPLIARLAERAHARRVTTPRKQLLAKAVWRVVDPALRLMLLLWALPRFDVFMFSYGTSFFNHREFPLLKRLGKRIICVFHGSDERPPYLSGVSAELPYATGTDWYINESVRQKTMVKRVSKSADFIVSHPLSAQFQERTCLSLIALGLPQKLASRREADRDMKGPVRILHAPSRPGSKGTGTIREIIEKLRSEGIEIDYIEIKGRPHSEVLEELAKCDFVVDEVWSDSPFATLAAEAAAAGRPTVVGGYGWSILSETIKAPLPRSVACPPEELENAIRSLATDRDLAARLGEEARAFVASEWSCTRVASRFLDVLENGGDASWYFDPFQVSYVLGYGMPRNKVGEWVKKMVDQGGTAALQLDDKPRLRDSILQLAGIPVDA
jgi:hypothetical protein